MRCYVFERVELVVYVVGVAGSNGAATTFADALNNKQPATFKSADREKPFAHMSAKNVMYVERVGCIAMHLESRRLRERAQRIAQARNIDYAEIDMELPLKRPRKKA
jgi:hypothetical protein